VAERLDITTIVNPVFVTTGIAFLCVLVGLVNGESANLTMAAGCVTVLAVYLLWTPGQPPTLLLLAALHLLQAETALVYANFLGVHVNTLSEFGVDLEKATAYALGGVLALILGMFFGGLGPAIWPASIARREARDTKPSSAFRFCCVSLGLAAAFHQLGNLSEGVRQFFLAAAGIEWIGIFVLSYVCLQQKRGFGYLLAVVALEVILGFTGFFGGFKTVFLVLFVAFAAARPKVNFVTAGAIAVVAGVALLLTVFWSEIKTDYRRFLNNGVDAQVVLVSMESRFEFLEERISNADLQTLASGFDKLLMRMSYVEFFGAAINFVPESRPHENGAMIGRAVEHILFPRMLFPDKAPLPLDTTVTAAYTGLAMTDSVDTSISIGYPGEFYIDFGVLGMLACMMGLGVFYGWSYRFVQKRCDSALVAYGATFAALFPGFMFETSLPKVIGGVVTSILIIVLLIKFVMPFALKALAWREAGAPRQLTRDEIYLSDEV
jgi:hypothetical protein